MSRRTNASVRALLLAGGLILCLAAPVAGREEVPFNGSLTGTAAISPLAPPFVSVLIDGTGLATQLGRFTVQNAHVVNQATRVLVGSYVFTAANGDTVTADFTGQATLASPGVLDVT